MEFRFDPKIHPLREVLSKVINIDDSSQLHLLHEIKGGSQFKSGNNYKSDKYPLLQNLTVPSLVSSFHQVYDKFVREVIIRHVASIMPDEVTMYYQSFPCLRVVRPSEFSIGPHSDISYGFSRANINFYVPFTDISGTNSLVLESSPG